MAKRPLPYPDTWRLLGAGAGEIGPADWDRAASWIDRHRLGAAMHGLLGDAGIEVPAPIADRWADAARRTALETLAFQQELVQLLDILAEERPRPIVLKGAFLAFHAHAQVGRRPMADLDILIEDREAAFRAFKLLLDHGYREYGEGNPALRIEEVTKHQLPPIQSPTGAEIDLHWRLGHDPHGKLTDEDYRARAITRPLLGREILYPSLEDQAAHLIGHAVVQNGFDNGAGVLFDLITLFGLEGFDFEAFEARLGEHGLTRAGAPLVAVLADLRPDLAIPPPRLARDDLVNGIELMVQLMDSPRRDLKDVQSMEAIGKRGWLRAKLLPSKRERLAGGTPTLVGHWKRLATERLPSLLKRGVLETTSIRRRFDAWSGARRLDR